MNTKVALLPLKSIIPDANQPRKYFAANKMAQLESSIKQHGVIQPLVVEDMGSGKYLLIDGERRFRAATNIGIKEVPAVIETPKNSTERLIRQFNVQEQHEAWTPLEKAQAITNLAEDLGLSLKKVCELLNVSEQDTRRYVAFATLADKSKYMRSELPLDYAQFFRSVVNHAERLTTEVLQKPWNDASSRKMEDRLIQITKEGLLKKGADAVRIKDSFTKKPELIEKFMSRSISPQEMYTEAKARGAHLLRNLGFQISFIHSYGEEFLKLRDVPLSPQMVERLKEAHETITKLIEMAE